MTDPECRRIFHELLADYQERFNLRDALLHQSRMASATGDKKRARELVDERQRIWLEILEELAPYLDRYNGVIVLEAISAMARDRAAGMVPYSMNHI